MIKLMARAFSACVFMIGSLALVIACVIAWLWIITTAARESHWLIGAILFVGSFYLGAKCEHWLRAPWTTWHQLWVYMDTGLDRRIKW